MVVAQKEWIAIENPIKVEDLVVRQFQEKNQPPDTELLG